MLEDEFYAKKAPLTFPDFCFFLFLMRSTHTYIVLCLIMYYLFRGNTLIFREKNIINNYNLRD